MEIALIILGVFIFLGVIIGIAVKSKGNSLKDSSFNNTSGTNFYSYSYDDDDDDDEERRRQEERRREEDDERW